MPPQRACSPTTPTANLKTATDWGGNQTAYINNAHGLPTQIVYASGSADDRDAGVCPSLLSPGALRRLFQLVRSTMPEPLKLYHAPASPNSRRVRMYLAEKGIAEPARSLGS